MKFKEYFGANYEFSEPEDLILQVKAMILAESLSGAEIDTLNRAWDVGLMESGDTPSKIGRASLVEKGILSINSWKENDYAFSVTYPLGYHVFRALSLKDRRQQAKEVRHADTDGS